MTFIPEGGNQTSRCIFSSSEELPSSDNKLYQVYEMNFFDDFKDCLAKLGGIPKVSVEQTVRYEIQVAELKKKQAEKQKKSRIW